MESLCTHTNTHTRLRSPRFPASLVLFSNTQALADRVCVCTQSRRKSTVSLSLPSLLTHFARLLLLVLTSFPFGRYSRFSKSMPMLLPTPAPFSPLQLHRFLPAHSFLPVMLRTGSLHLLSLSKARLSTTRLIFITFFPTHRLLGVSFLNIFRIHTRTSTYKLPDRHTHTLTHRHT